MFYCLGTVIAGAKVVLEHQVHHRHPKMAAGFSLSSLCFSN